MEKTMETKAMERLIDITFDFIKAIQTSADVAFQCANELTQLYIKIGCPYGTDIDGLKKWFEKNLEEVK